MISLEKSLLPYFLHAKGSYPIWKDGGLEKFSAAPNSGCNYQRATSLRLSFDNDPDILGFSWYAWLGELLNSNNLLCAQVRWLLISE